MEYISKTETDQDILRKRNTFWIIALVLICVSVIPMMVRSQSTYFSNSEPEKIADGFQFTEGPCWRAGGYLVFSDISGNTVYRWTEDKGAEVYLSPSYNSNGLAEDSEGRLLMAQHGQRRLARLEADGSQTALATHYNGKQLNSPNDIAIKSDGSIYFTDPPYGITPGQEELGFYGVYRLEPDNGNLLLLVDSLHRPNGLIFSPDESILYVADTDERRILSYRVDSNGSLSNGQVFVYSSGDCYVDGLEIDPEGNLYAACSDAGVRIFSEQGTCIDSIEVPERTRNLAWGDADKGTLYITAGTGVYRIRPESPEYAPEMVFIPGGEFDMGDHHELGGLEHGNDELPIHSVYIDSFYMGKFEVTNREYSDYLDAALSRGLIEMRDGYVYGAGGTEIFCETYPTVDHSQLAWDGSTFTVLNNRETHPVTGVRWFGAISYCNWLSAEENLEACYDLSSGDCDFSQNGFRLPTEAEWEYAGRGARYDPYYIFPWGDDENTDGTLANWPESGDPFESGPVPLTTPVGFYNGELHQKTEFDWPGSRENYLASDGSNAYGLYDMSGNVWEWVYDWYDREYYSVSPYVNPTGPETGSPMPDGEPYRTLRGGNWYNGQEYWGHGRVSNRNPSYYRGPDDPDHAWYHIGFRIARNYEAPVTGITDRRFEPVSSVSLFSNVPNPFRSTTTIGYELPEHSDVNLGIYTIFGQQVSTLVDAVQPAGVYHVIWDASGLDSGIYICRIDAGKYRDIIKMLLIR